MRERRRFVAAGRLDARSGGSIAGQFVPHDMHVARGLNSQADIAAIDPHHLNRDAQCGKQNAIVRATRENEHDLPPWPSGRLGALAPGLALATGVRCTTDSCV
jgi:hypothetical protein